ncbi:hypothetical protein SETIT_2G279900v2 [Setaria italica]|uniref:Uncharacterized protein n=1 Tax=Setaria italica TaxID=4555 RepID=A0A368Q435_SETIT|nr:hypothetical protein SETIT_2G279900v2 [Setaria italica]
MFPGGRRRRRLHEQPLREAGIVRVQVHVAEPVGLERFDVQCRRLVSLHRYLLKRRRRRAGNNVRQWRRSRHAGCHLVDGGAAGGGLESALEVRDGLEGGAAGVVQARERGRRRHGEQPRGVREVEAARPRSAAAQGEHRGVVRARRGLGGDVAARRGSPGRAPRRPTGPRRPGGARRGTPGAASRGTWCAPRGASWRAAGRTRTTATRPPCCCGPTRRRTPRWRRRMARARGGPCPWLPAAAAEVLIPAGGCLRSVLRVE